MKYKIILFWSEEDDAFLAEMPELPGCMTHGDSYESALANAKEAIAFRLELAGELTHRVSICAIGMEEVQ